MSQLEYGKQAEDMVFECLRRNGWWEIPVPCESKSQMFEGRVWIRKGKAIFVDAKRKRRWVREVSNRTETGFDLSAFRKYEAHRVRLGCECYAIFIHEHDDPGVWFVRLGDHEPRIWDGRNAGGEVFGSAEVFWDRDTEMTCMPSMFSYDDASALVGIEFKF